jgi:hypothetical protein
MSSTQNKNTYDDYQVKKKESVKHVDYMLFDGFSKNENPALFVRGSNTSMYASHLSYNPIDIESTLRGIRSTNLEGPSFKATPQLKHLPEIEYFKTDPTFIPQPYYHSTQERPLYLN